MENCRKGGVLGEKKGWLATKTRDLEVKRLKMDLKDDPNDQMMHKKRRKVKINGYTEELNHELSNC